MYGVEGVPAQSFVCLCVSNFKMFYIYKQYICFLLSDLAVNFKQNVNTSQISMSVWDIYICVSVCICIYVYTITQKHTYINVHLHIYLHVYVCTNKYIYLSLYIYICIIFHGQGADSDGEYHAWVIRK